MLIGIYHKLILCDQIIHFRDSSWIEQDTSLGTKYDKIIGWNWDFGDGSLASALQHPAHLIRLKWGLLYQASNIYRAGLRRLNHQKDTY